MALIIWLNLYSTIISRSSSSSFLRLKRIRIKKNKNKLNPITAPIITGFSKASTKVSGIGIIGVGLTGPPIVIITPSLSSSFGSVSGLPLGSLPSGLSSGSPSGSSKSGLSGSPGSVLSGSTSGLPSLLLSSIWKSR